LPRFARRITGGGVRHLLRGLRLPDGLLRQRVHEIEVDVVEDRQRRDRGGTRLIRVVDAAERREVRVVEALDAERQPVDAGGPESGEPVAGLAVRQP
jgi:hypothetical protein